MKNLIVILGLILLMSTAMVHDADTVQLLAANQRIRRIGNEMADAAAIALKSGNGFDAAKSSAAQVLQKYTEEGMEWTMTLQDNAVHIRIESGPVSMRLPVTGEDVTIKYHAKSEI